VESGDRGTEFEVHRSFDRKNGETTLLPCTRIVDLMTLDRPILVTLNNKNKNELERMWKKAALTHLDACA
jgi:hypothetical protein